MVSDALDRPRREPGAGSDVGAGIREAARAATARAASPLTARQAGRLIAQREAEQDADVPGLAEYALSRGWSPAADRSLLPHADLIAELTLTLWRPSTAAAHPTIRFTNSYGGGRRRITILANAYTRIPSAVHGQAAEDYAVGVLLIRTGEPLAPVAVLPRSAHVFAKDDPRIHRTADPDFDRRYQIAAAQLPASGPLLSRRTLTAVDARDDWAFWVQADVVLVVRRQPFASADDLDNFLGDVGTVVAGLPGL
jgi:hypothetical protein